MSQFLRQSAAAAAGGRAAVSARLGSPALRPHTLGTRLSQRLAVRCAGSDAAPAYRLHTYDHCPFCNRVEILLARFSIPYERELYGYGEGASPEACGGTGYNPGGGPVALTGKKMLPVLEGEGVPAPAGARGMAESLEICSYLIARHGLVVPCDSGRADLASFRSELQEFARLLIKPREVKMPVKDWADPRDVAYARWKYATKAGLDYEAALAATPELLARANAKLQELAGLIRGADSLNSWGFGMDDVVLLPHLRALACVKGVVFPEPVAAYMQASLKAAASEAEEDEGPRQDEVGRTHPRRPSPGGPWSGEGRADEADDVAEAVLEDCRLYDYSKDAC